LVAILGPTDGSPGLGQANRTRAGKMVIGDGASLLGPSVIKRD